MAKQKPAVEEGSGSESVHEQLDSDHVNEEEDRKNDEPDQRNACAASSIPGGHDHPRPRSRSQSRSRSRSISPLPSLPDFLANLHINELAKTSGSKVVANTGKMWKNLVGAIYRNLRREQINLIAPEMNALEASIIGTVDAYVNKKGHEMAEIAGKEASTKQLKELSSMMPGCRCTTGGCSTCVCSLKAGGPGFCTPNCSCRENCCIGKYKVKKNLEQLMEEAAMKARAKVLRKAKEKKKKAANERESSSSESEEEPERKKKKKKSKKEESSSSSSESESDKKKKKKKKSVVSSDSD